MRLLATDLHLFIGRAVLLGAILLANIHDADAAPSPAPAPSASAPASPAGPAPEAVTRAPSQSMSRTVLVVRAPSDRGGWVLANDRARAEIESMGLVAETLDAPNPAFSESEIARHMLERNALASVRITRDAETNGAPFTLWVMDRVTGKTSSRQVPQRDLVTASANDEATVAAHVALLAVELLHASLLEVRVPHPPRGSMTAPPQVMTWVGRKLLEPVAPPRWGFRAGATLIGTPSSTGAAASPEAGLLAAISYSFVPHWLVDGSILAAVVRGSVRSSLGSTRMGIILPRGHLVYDLLPTGKFSAQVGLGVGALVLDASGSAEDPYVGSVDWASVAVGSAMAAITVRLGPDLRILLESHVAMAAHPLDVRFAEVTVARIGRPLVDTGIALQGVWAD